MIKSTKSKAKKARKEAESQESYLKLSRAIMNPDGVAKVEDLKPEKRVTRGKNRQLPPLPLWYCSLVEGERVAFRANNADYAAVFYAYRLYQVSRKAKYVIRVWDDNGNEVGVFCVEGRMQFTAEPYNAAIHAHKKEPL